MMFLSPRSWLKPLQWQAKVCRRLPRRIYRTSRSIRPRLEQLEDRLTPSLFTASPTVVDGAAGSLRNAINQVNADTGAGTDTIQLSAGTYTLTIPNTGNNHELNNAQGDLNIGNDVQPIVIQGATDAKGNPTSIIQQTVADRVLEIDNPGSNVTIKNVILQGGNAQENGGLGLGGQSDALGGGILNLGGNVTLSNVAVAANQATAGTGFSALGGGIYSQDGALTINHSTIAVNTASDGGGDATYGGGVAFELPTNPDPHLTITNSTVANNDVQGPNDPNPASGSGGGVALQGYLLLVNSTIAGNSATNQGGGIFFQGGAIGALGNDTVSRNVAAEGGGLDNNTGDIAPVHLENTIVAGNTIVNNTGVLDQDIAGQFISNGHNLIGINNNFVDLNGNTDPTDLLGTAANPLNPHLGPLQNNGGPTQTMALLPGSPAIGKGDTTVLGITGPYDQRGPGFARKGNGVVDIGAYQFTQPTTGGGGGGGGTTQTPPSLIQAVFSLFFDGIYLEIDLLEGGSLDNFNITPGATAAFPVLTALDHFLGDPSVAALQDSINFNMKYAGPFGPFVEMLGESEIEQILPPQLL